MERLSQKGVMMTNAYACPVSTPTRASLMTGMNPAHMKITSFISLYKDIVPDAIGGHPGATNENLDDIFAHRSGIIMLSAPFLSNRNVKRTDSIIPSMQLLWLKFFVMRAIIPFMWEGALGTCGYTRFKSL